MAGRTNDFERFLYANYPDDYRRATADGVTDDVITAILSKHDSHYKVWREIPEWIKSRYQDIIPTEVLNGNENVEGFVETEEKKLNEEEKETRELMDYGVSLLVLGYAAETVAIMVENRSKRMQLQREARGGNLTAEQMAKWLATRESDKRAITADWKDNQTEKYLLHLIKKLDRDAKRLQKNGTESEKAAFEMKAAEAEKEIRKTLEKMTDVGAKKKLVNYLRQQPQQAALRHLSPDSMGRLSAILREQGINISPVSEKTAQTAEMNRHSLAQSLQGHFERSQKMEAVMREKYQHQNKAFQRVGTKENVKPRRRKNREQMVALRKEVAERERA